MDLRRYRYLSGGASSNWNHIQSIVEEENSDWVNTIPRRLFADAMFVEFANNQIRLVAPEDVPEPARTIAMMMTRIEVLEKKVKDECSEFYYNGITNTNNLNWSAGNCQNTDCYELEGHPDRIVIKKAGTYHVSGFLYMVVNKDDRWIQGKKNGVEIFKVWNSDRTSTQDRNNNAGFSFVFQANENDYFQIYTNQNFVQYTSGRNQSSMFIRRLKID